MSRCLAVLAALTLCACHATPDPAWISRPRLAPIRLPADAIAAMPSPSGGAVVRVSGGLDGRASEILHFDRDGTLAWRIVAGTLGGPMTSTSNRRGVLYLDDATHELVEVDAASGAERRRLALPASLEAELLVARGHRRWVIGAGETNLRCHELVDGVLDAVSKCPDLVVSGGELRVMARGGRVVWWGHEEEGASKVLHTTGFSLIADEDIAGARWLDDGSLDVVYQSKAARFSPAACTGQAARLELSGITTAARWQAFCTAWDISCPPASAACAEVRAETGGRVAVSDESGLDLVFGREERFVDSSTGAPLLPVPGERESHPIRDVAGRRWLVVVRDTADGGSEHALCPLEPGRSCGALATPFEGTLAPSSIFLWTSMGRAYVVLGRTLEIVALP